MRNTYRSHVEPRLGEIKSWAEAGVSEKQIAERLGIAYSSFRSHKAKNPALLAALTAALPKLMENVESTAIRIASGYNATEITREYGFDRARHRVLIREIERTKHVPASAAMTEFILCNKDPAHWRRKQEVASLVQINPKDIRSLDLSKLSDAELAQLADSMVE